MISLQRHLLDRCLFLFPQILTSSSRCLILGDCIDCSINQSWGSINRSCTIFKEIWSKARVPVGQHRRGARLRSLLLSSDPTPADISWLPSYSLHAFNWRLIKATFVSKPFVLPLHATLSPTSTPAPLVHAVSDLISVTSVVIVADSVLLPIGGLCCSSPVRFLFWLKSSWLNCSYIIQLLITFKLC